MPRARPAPRSLQPQPAMDMFGIHSPISSFFADPDRPGINPFGGPRMRPHRCRFVLLALFAVAACGAAMAPARADDPVSLSFVILGCNRIQHRDWKGIKDQDPS